MVENKNINLMPEDLRHKEQEARDKVRLVQASPDFSQPKKEIETLKIKEKKPSFLAKISNIFQTIKKPTVTSPLTNNKAKNGDRFKSLASVKLAKKPDWPLPSMVDRHEQVAKSIPPILPISPIPQPPIVKSDIPLKDNKSEFHQPEKIIRARFVDDALGVNLVPASSKLKTWKQLSILAIITFLGSVGVVAVFYFGLLTIDKKLDSSQVDTMRQIANIESQLLDFEALNKEINKTGQEINLTYNVLNKHIYWTNFFRLLEKYTIEEVYYTGFSAGNNGAMTLDAIGDDYTAVARQLKILQQEEAQEFVSEVDISSASQGEGGVSFSITLVLNPELFYYQTFDETL